MKINETIKERRLAKNLTQEQVASYLGVTAPAVHKWEKGTSYPDITLLPALARLLDTDLNTLLSFKEDLTEQEIAMFLNQLSELLDTNGIACVFEAAASKIKDFPTCSSLIFNTASFLDGALVMFPTIENVAQFEAFVDDLYHRALQSQDSCIQNRAKAIIISKLIQQEHYEEAQSLLLSLPDQNLPDKKQIQANLFIKLGRLDDAAKIEEEKLLAATNEIHQILMTLIEIALKEDRIEDAEYIANVSKDGSLLFDLWEYSSYVAHFQLYTACKNRLKWLKTLVPMLKSLTHKWEINASPLYRHIQGKKSDQAFGTSMQKTLLHSICADESTEFFKQDPAFQSILEEYDCAEGKNATR